MKLFRKLKVELLDKLQIDFVLQIELVIELLIWNLKEE